MTTVYLFCAVIQLVSRTCAVRIYSGPKKQDYTNNYLWESEIAVRFGDRHNNLASSTACWLTQFPHFPRLHFAKRRKRAHA